jgi:hypothetical protein
MSCSSVVARRRFLDRGLSAAAPFAAGSTRVVRSFAAAQAYIAAPELFIRRTAEREFIGPAVAELHDGTGSSATPLAPTRWEAENAA